MCNYEILDDIGNKRGTVETYGHGCLRFNFRHVYGDLITKCSYIRIEEFIEAMEYTSRFASFTCSLSTSRKEFQLTFNKNHIILEDCHGNQLMDFDDFYELYNKDDDDKDEEEK